MLEIPGYSIERVLGQGGMATVYLAVQQSLGRHVALKLLIPSLARDPVATERFLREARIAAKLHHPHIIEIHDVGIHDGLPYMAMAYEPGGTVAQLINHADTPMQALRIVRDIASALDFAHRQGVVHRDIKPENILRRSDGASVLSDFGIARAAEIKLGLTGEGTSIGTPHYMSPEQWRGEVVDGRADLYGLGVVLFQLLSGKLPYDGANGWTVGMQHMNAPIPSLPPALQYLQRLVDDLLAKDPAARPQTGFEVIQRIDAHLSGQREIITTILPTLPNSGQSAAMSLPTRPAAASTTWVLAAAGLLLIGMLAWQPWRGARGSADAATDTDAVAAIATTDASIAVLPFADLSPTHDQAYFSDGLSEELLDLLAKLPQLRVAGRTSAFQFREGDPDIRRIGRRLGVNTILTGSVRRSGERLRVTVQLLNCADGFHLWSETYDRQIVDVFTMQDDIAQSVVAALKIKLLPEQRPDAALHRSSNAEAYTEYLRGRQSIATAGADAAQTAVASLRKAITIDPNFAAAHARLAQALMWSAEYADDDESYVRAHDEALAAVAHAIDLDPGLADGYWIRGNLLSTVNWDWRGARDDYDRALALDPGSGHAAQGYGALLASLGRLPDAIAMTRRLTEREPLLPSAWQALGYFQEATGDLVAARESQHRALALKPDFPFAHMRLAVMALTDQQLDTADSEFKATRYEPLQWLGEAVMYHLRGDVPGSDRALAQLVDRYAFNAAYQIAEVEAARGNSDAAFTWLSRAIDQRDGGIAEIKYDPLLASLRGDPRYRELLLKLGLPL